MDDELQSLKAQLELERIEREIQDNEKFYANLLDTGLTHAINGKPIDFEGMLREILALRKERDRIAQLLIKPTQKETPNQRRERLAARKAALKAQGVRDFNRILAEEEGVSLSRIKQLLSNG